MSWVARVEGTEAQEGQGAKVHTGLGPRRSPDEDVVLKVGSWLGNRKHRISNVSLYFVCKPQRLLDSPEVILLSL